MSKAKYNRKNKSKYRYVTPYYTCSSQRLISLDSRFIESYLFMEEDQKNTFIHKDDIIIHA